MVDYALANQSRTAFRTELNEILEALVSNAAGPTAPTTTFPGMLWVDTSGSPTVLRIRNAADSAWVALGALGSSGWEPGTATAVGLALMRAADAAAGRAAIDAMGGSAIEVTDWNDATDSGVYWSQASAGNDPINAALAGVVIDAGGNSTIQIVGRLGTVDGDLWVRRRLSGTWGSWTKMATEGYVNGLAIGVGQTWQSFVGSRAVSTSYQNTTGRPISVHVQLDRTSSNGSAKAEVSTDNSTWIQVACGAATNIEGIGVTFIVPASHYYRVSGTGTGSILAWSELR